MDLKQNALGLTAPCFESYRKTRGTDPLSPMNRGVTHNPFAELDNGIDEGHNSSYRKKSKPKGVDTIRHTGQLCLNFDKL